MTASIVSRHRDIDIGSPRSQKREERRCQERHVTPNHDDLLRGRIHQRRINAAECPRPGNAIDRHADMLALTAIAPLDARSVARDDQDMRGQRSQQGHLPIEDRCGTDDQRALLDAAQPPRPTAGKDGCCPGNNPLNHE